MTVNGRSCLNLATFNFLGFVGDKDIEVLLSEVMFRNHKTSSARFSKELTFPLVPVSKKSFTHVDGV